MTNGFQQQDRLSGFTTLKSAPVQQNGQKAYPMRASAAQAPPPRSFQPRRP